METGEARTARAELVEDGGFDGRMPVTAEIAVTEIIGHDENDVGRADFGNGWE